MRGLFKRKKKEPASPIVYMPYEAEILSLEPGQRLIFSWKGKPLYVRRATVLEIEEEIDNGTAIGGAK